MAITAGTLPSQVPFEAAPFDVNLALSTQPGPQVLTATGYMGAPAQPDIGPGRVEGYWAIDITAIDVVTGDERYDFFLLGSNDVAWGNGNVEMLTMRSFGGATGRPIATILGASPAIPPFGAAGSLTIVPFSNLSQRIVFRYLRGYLLIAGTTPSVTFHSWISMDCNAC